MVVELPAEFEYSVKAQALSRGLSVEAYVLDVVERDLRRAEETSPTDRPFETGRGILAAYGPAPSSEEIDRNRAEMFRGFGESF